MTSPKRKPLSSLPAITPYPEILLYYLHHQATMSYESSLTSQPSPTRPYIYPYPYYSLPLTISIYTHHSSSSTFPLFNILVLLALGLLPRLRYPGPPFPFPPPHGMIHPYGPPPPHPPKTESIQCSPVSPGSARAPRGGGRV